jgi:hypothetical protein
LVILNRGPVCEPYIIQPISVMTEAHVITILAILVTPQLPDGPIVVDSDDHEGIVKVIWKELFAAVCSNLRESLADCPIVIG